MKNRRYITDIEEEKIKPWRVRENPITKGDVDFCCELSILKDAGQIIQEFEDGRNKTKNPILIVAPEYAPKSFLYGNDFDRVDKIISFWDEFPFWEYKVRYDTRQYRVILYDDSSNPKIQMNVASGSAIPILKPTFISGSCSPAQIAMIAGI